MLKINNLTGYSAPAAGGGGGGGGGVQISLEDNGFLNELPRSVSLGSAITNRLIVIAYFDVGGSGVVPSDTTLTLGGSAMTRVATLTSGLSGSPNTDGYKCTFYYLQVDSGTSVSLTRSGGTAFGGFEVFRLTGWTSAAPAHSDGTGTTTGSVTSLSRTIAIPANGGLIASAYAGTSGNSTYTGASQVLNGFASAATRTVTDADASHTVTVNRGTSGGLFFIVGSWG